MISSTMIIAQTLYHVEGRRGHDLLIRILMGGLPTISSEHTPVDGLPHHDRVGLRPVRLHLQCAQNKLLA